MTQNQTQTYQGPDLSLLNIRQVAARLSFNKSYVSLLVSQKRFPSPIKFGIRCSRWTSQQVNDWIEEVAADPKKAAAQ